MFRTHGKCGKVVLWHVHELPVQDKDKVCVRGENIWYYFSVNRLRMKNKRKSGMVVHGHVLIMHASILIVEKTKRKRGKVGIGEPTVCLEKALDEGSRCLKNLSILSPPGLAPRPLG